MLLLPHSIWIDPTVYEVMPVLLPHLMRVKEKFSAERRGEPNDQMYAKDENSALKSIPGLKIAASPNPLVAGYKHRGWAASHIVPTRWFTDCQKGYGNSNGSEMYSFIPNVVWLPGAYAHYTDFGSLQDYQQEELPLFNVYLYSFSRFLYEHRISTASPHYRHCDGLWATFQMHVELSGSKLRSFYPDQWHKWHVEDVHRVSLFDTTRFFQRYWNKKLVPPAIQQLLNQAQDFASVLSSHGSEVPMTDNDKRKALRRFAAGIKAKCHRNSEAKAAATAAAARLQQYCERCVRKFASVQRKLTPVQNGLPARQTKP
jgi:hypothetical protein